jgi:hypothetical protein
MQQVFASTFVVGSLLLQLCPMVVPLQRAHFPAASDYAIEYKDSNGQPTFTPIMSAAPTTLLFYHFSRLKDWHRPSTHGADASAVKLVCSREDDALKMLVFVYFGPFDQNDSPRSLEGVPNKLAGVYSARLHEKVVIQGLSQFGIEPLEVGIVPARSEVTNPPQIINKTSSIEVLGVEEARGQYLVSLRNNSHKDVIGLNIYLPTKDGRTSQLAQSFPDKPLIPSGQVYEMQIHISRSGRQTPEGFVPNEPEQPRIAIAGVLFADSTHEGEVETAVAVSANRRGRKLQVDRLLALLDEAVENQVDDVGSAIEELRKQVVALSEEPEPWVMRQVAEDFPGLEGKAMWEIRAFVTGGLNSEKQSMLFAIRDFERERVERGTSLEMWVSRMKNQYVELMTKL